MAKTSDEVIALLKQDLDTTRVKTRKAPGMDGGVPYLEGHDVINVANDIFDFRWSFEMSDVKIERWPRLLTRWNNTTRTKDPVLDKDGNPLTEMVGIAYATGCVTVTLGDEVFTHGDVGRSIISGDSPEALDTAIAGAATDLLKRCFRQLGNQFGIQLYDKEFRDEELGQNGNSGQSGNGQSGNGNGQRSNSTGTQPRSNGTGTQPRTAQSSTRPAASGQSKPAVATQPQAPAPSAPADNTLENAKKLVIPQGVPLAGKTLGEAMADPALGVFVVRWLTGTEQNKSNKLFVPANKDDEALMAGAKLLLAQK